jgi:hypothetical protein
VWLRVLTGALILVAVVVAGIFGIKALTGGNGEIERTLKFGDATVSISVPEDIPPNELLVAVLQDYLPQTGFYPFYKQCLLEAAEGRQGTFDVRSLRGLSFSERIRRSLDFYAELEQGCRSHQDGQDIFDPSATEDQIELMRVGLARGIRAELPHEFPASVTACAGRQIKTAPAAEVIGIVNGTEREQLAIFRLLFDPCFKLAA